MRCLIYSELHQPTVAFADAMKPNREFPRPIYLGGNKLSYVTGIPNSTSCSLALQQQHSIILKLIHKTTAQDSIIHHSMMASLIINST